MNETDELLEQRQQTHGEFKDNAMLGQTLRALFRGTIGWTNASLEEREALDMIATKLSRILSGQPHIVQHWEDIAGYAQLVVRGLSHHAQSIYEETNKRWPLPLEEGKET